MILVVVVVSRSRVIVVTVGGTQAFVVAIAIGAKAIVVVW